MLHEVFLFGVLLPTVITVVCFIGFLVCWFRYNWRRRRCCSAAEKPSSSSTIGRKSVCLKCACGVARRTSRECDEEACSPPRSSSSGDGRCERCFGRGTTVYPAETGVRPIRFSSSSSSWFSYAVVDKPLWLAPGDADLESSMMNYVVAEPRKNLLRGPPPSTRRTSKARSGDGRCGCPTELEKTAAECKCQRKCRAKVSGYYYRPKGQADLNDLASTYGTREGRHDLDVADRMTRLPVDDTTPFDVFSSHEEETFYVEVQPNFRQNATKECSTGGNPPEFNHHASNSDTAVSCDHAPVDSQPNETVSDSIQGNRHFVALDRDTVYQCTDLTPGHINNDSSADRKGLTSVCFPEANDLNRRASVLTLDDHDFAPGNSGIGHIHRPIVRRLENGCLATRNNGSTVQNGNLASCANNQANHPSEDSDLSPPNSSELSSLDISGDLSPQNYPLSQYSDDISPPPRSSKLSPQTELSSENSSDLSTHKANELSP